MSLPGDENHQSYEIQKSGRNEDDGGEKVEWFLADIPAMSYGRDDGTEAKDG